MRHRLHARAGAEIEAADGLRSGPATPKEKPDQDLAAEDLEVDEDAEVSADEEVDLETGDNDLGVEATKEDDEN